MSSSIMNKLYSHFRIGLSKCQVKTTAHPGHETIMKTSSLKLSVEVTSETLKIHFFWDIRPCRLYQYAQCYITEGGNRHWQRCDNLESCFLKHCAVLCPTALQICRVINVSFPPLVTNSLRTASFREALPYHLSPSLHHHLIKVWTCFPILKHFHVNLSFVSIRTFHIMLLTCHW
jgi:hypothetical protein